MNAQTPAVEPDMVEAVCTDLAALEADPKHGGDNYWTGCTICTSPGRAIVLLRHLSAECDLLKAQVRSAVAAAQPVWSGKLGAAEARVKALEGALRKIAGEKPTGVRDPAGDGQTRILTGHEYQQLQSIASAALSVQQGSETE